MGLLSRRRPAAGLPASNIVPGNAGAELVPVFTTDERGAALAQGLINANAVHLNGTPPMIDTRSEKWNGWTAAPQAMYGLANLGAGRPIVARGNTFDQETGAIVSSPVQRIFEDRMAAGRFQ